MKAWLFVWPFVWLLLACLPLRAQVIVYTENFPPFQYMENGVLAGQSTKVVREVLQAANVPAEFSLRPWANAYHSALNQPNSLIYSMVRIPAREPLFHWLGEVGDMRIALFTLAEREDIQLTNLLDLNQYSVVTFINSAPAQYLADRGVTSVIEVSDGVSLARMLLSERIDVVVMSEHSFYASVMSEGRAVESVRMLMPIDSLNRGLWLAANLDTDPEYIAAIRHAFQEHQYPPIPTIDAPLLAPIIDAH